MKFNVLVIAALFASVEAVRLNAKTHAPPDEAKITQLAEQLGIPMTPEIMQMGDNEAISGALVEIAIGMGKTPEEISAAVAE